METKKFCQSCSMPLDNPEMLGTERDGSKNNDYCKYCYQDGHFLSPGMSLTEMTSLVKTQLEKKHATPDIITRAVNSLPQLKRWRAKASL